MTQICTIFGVEVTPTALLSALVVTADVVAYYIYNREIFKGKASPSVVVWGISSVIGVCNCASYFVVSEDVVKTALAMENALACLITFGFTCRYGQVKRLKWDEVAYLAFGIVGVIAWWIFRQAFYANALFQFGAMVAFWPFLTKTWIAPRSEPRIPWGIWAAVYLTNLTIVLARWHGSWRELFYPINYAVLHLAVFLLTLRAKRKTPEVRISYTG